MENRLANPVPLGLIAFAMTTWLWSMVNAGWYSDAGMPVVLAMALVVGGAVQAIAGILAFSRGNTFATVAFLGYGSFYISLVSLLGVFGVAPHVPPQTMIAWYLIGWFAFTLFMWFASLRQNMALALTFLAWSVAFALLAIADWTGWRVVYDAGGYAGLVTAVVAAYLAAAEMINADYGRTILPTWPVETTTTGARVEQTRVVRDEAFIQPTEPHPELEPRTRVRTRDELPRS